MISDKEVIRFGFTVFTPPQKCSVCGKEIDSGFVVMNKVYCIQCYRNKTSQTKIDDFLTQKKLDEFW